MPESWSSRLPEYEVVLGNADRCVAISARQAKEFRQILVKDKASLHHWMGQWCDDVDSAIPDTRFKAQERHAGPQGQNIMIFAFKSYQARLYGFSRTMGNKETFFVTAVDPDKKDNRADPQMLARAGAEAVRILLILGLR